MYLLLGQNYYVLSSMKLRYLTMKGKKKPCRQKKRVTFDSCKEKKPLKYNRSSMDNMNVLAVDKG